MTNQVNAHKEELPVCVYCGQRPGETRDHVVAKCFFPGSLPSDMITVPCCEECNRRYSTDEDYVRSLICMDYRVVESNDSALRQLVGPVTRSLMRTDYTGLLRSIMNSSRPVTLYSKGGICLGKTRAVRRADERFDNVARKIILGLYYHETGQRLADGYTVQVKTIGTDMEFAANTLGSCPISWSLLRILGNDVFRYMYSFVDTDPGLSVWVFDFYGSFIFIGMTASPELKAEVDQRLKKKEMQTD
jgi:hypothetical protein